MNIFKIDNGHFYQKLYYIENGEAKIAVYGPGYGNLPAQADFNFDLLISTDDYYNYSGKIFNIQNNLNIEGNNCAFDISFSFKMYITINGQKIEIKDFGHTQHSSETSDSFTTLNSSIDFTFQSSTKDFDNIIISFHETVAYEDRYYTQTFLLQSCNSNPIISGSDIYLGEKNEGFNIDYTVNDPDGDNVSITETLNDTVLRNLSNLSSNISESLIITNEQLYSLPLNQSNTIKIVVNDGKGGTCNRSYTFTRTDTPPKINIIEKSYPVIKFKCYDSDLNDCIIKATVNLNGTLKQTYENNFDSELKYNINFSDLNDGNNIFEIVTTDKQGVTNSVQLNIAKKSLNIQASGANIIVNGNMYTIKNSTQNNETINLTLDKALLTDVSTKDKIEILNDSLKVFAKTDFQNNYKEMDFVNSIDLNDGYVQEKYQLNIMGKKATTKINMSGNMSVKQIQESYQYLSN